MGDRSAVLAKRTDTRKPQLSIILDYAQDPRFVTYPSGCCRSVIATPHRMQFMRQPMTFVMFMRRQLTDIPVLAFAAMWAIVCINVTV